MNNQLDLNTYQDKKLIAFDLYGTCIHNPKGIFERGFYIPRELRKILETNPIDLNQIENSNIEFKGMKIELPKETINQIRKSIAEVLVYPDFKDTIEYLKNKGYQTAVISNLAKPYEEPLNRLISKGTFDYQALSFDIGNIKPNAKIFEHVKDESGIDFENMVMIGDSLKSDVLGASNVGISPIYLNRKSEGITNQEKHGINFIQISTLSDLKDIL